MPFVRARHEEGDEEVFFVRDQATVGQRDHHAVVLPDASVREDLGHLVVTPGGLRLVPTARGQKSISLKEPAVFGPFALSEVTQGDAEVERGTWSCRFRPRVLARFRSLLFLSIADRYANGRALVIDTAAEDPILCEAVTWLKTAQSARRQQRDIDKFAAALTSQPRPHASPHLLQPLALLQTNSVCALLFPFRPSMPFHRLTTDTVADVIAGEQGRGRIPRAVALALQSQLGRLLVDRDRVGAKMYPFDWTQLRIGFDGHLRLPVCGPADWRERGTSPNVGALVAGAAAMMNAATQDATPLIADVVNIVFHPGEDTASAQLKRETDIVSGWMRGLAPQTLTRQEHYFEQVALLDLDEAASIRSSE